MKGQIGKIEYIFASFGNRITGGHIKFLLWQISNGNFKISGTEIGIHIPWEPHPFYRLYWIFLFYILLKNAREEFAFSLTLWLTLMQITLTFSKFRVRCCSPLGMICLNRWPLHTLSIPTLHSIRSTGKMWGRVADGKCDRC